MVKTRPQLSDSGVVALGLVPDLIGGSVGAYLILLRTGLKKTLRHGQCFNFNRAELKQMRRKQDDKNENT